MKTGHQIVLRFIIDNANHGSFVPGQSRDGFGTVFEAQWGKKGDENIGSVRNCRERLGIRLHCVLKEDNENHGS